MGASCLQEGKMIYAARVLFHQSHLDETLNLLVKFHALSIEAEDEGDPDVYLLYRECRRYEWMASLIAATGVEYTRYADN
jgi:hypothetical protein